MKPPCAPLAGFAGLLVLSTSLLAQAVVPPPSAPTATRPIEDVVELPPFQVLAGDNAGWTPNQTLAGTRFRTKLGDLATQMEVFTMDFMDDFGFTNVEQASVYSLNIENSNEFVSNVEAKGGGEDTLRVRGMGQARRSREFFATSTRTDNYNLDRVTLASGPNPMMFGIGAPTGAIDSTLARPVMNRNFGKVRMQTDDWSGLRGEFQLNQTLFKDKLAFRAALLADNKKADIKPSIDRERRAYGALLYTPFRKTRISAHFEAMKGHNRTPSRVPPLDKVRVWYTAGDLGSALGNMYLFPNNLAWQTGRPASSGANAIPAKQNPDGSGDRGGRHHEPQGDCHSPVPPLALEAPAGGGSVAPVHQVEHLCAQYHRENSRRQLYGQRTRGKRRSGIPPGAL
jgi:hypothetical protein